MTEMERSRPVAPGARRWIVALLHAAFLALILRNVSGQTFWSWEFNYYTVGIVDLAVLLVVAAVAVYVAPWVGLGVSAPLVVMALAAGYAELFSDLHLPLFHPQHPGGVFAASPGLRGFAHVAFIATGASSLILALQGLVFGAVQVAREGRGGRSDAV
ncbi:MAG: hypothetical protein ACYTAF_16110 [Planctomycetota bacterium]|jgi:hypothetical protein